MKKALVVLSGGQDSTTCLYWAKKHYDEVLAVSFNYGQRHEIELQSSYEIAKAAGVARELIDIRNTLVGTSPLVSSNKVAKYKDVYSLPGGLEDTFVPARNALFLTIAANRAYVNKCDAIVIGVSQEDFGGYPDCRSTFIEAMEFALRVGVDNDIKIETPLINLSKKDTVLLAHELGADCWRALGLSHTCYDGKRPPCGKCHACLLRQKGFDEAGFKDPIFETLKQGSLL